MEEGEFSFMDFDLLEVAKNECFSVLNIALDNIETYDFTVDTQDSDGNSLLHYTAAAGNIETLEKLISLSAYPNILNNKRETPLHLACQYGHFNIAVRLLEFGAKLDALDHERETPLFKSVRGKNKSLTKHLIIQRAIVTNTNKGNERLIHLAVIHDDIKLVEVLLDVGQDLDVITGDGEAPLQLAVKFSKLEIVNLLLGRSANKDIRDHRNCTLLHLAVEAKSKPICQTLISSGLGVNEKDKNGSTALHLAVEANNLDIVDLLLKNQADINLADLDGYTPLHTAARIRKGSDVLSLLLKNNADTEAKTEHGDLPLHVAAGTGNIRGYMLLYNKRDNNVGNNMGLTPLQLAEVQEHTVIVQVNFELERNNNSNVQKIPIYKQLYMLKRRSIR